MLTASAASMRAIERRAMDEYAISSLTLMERAAEAVCRRIAALLPDGKRIAVLCGHGKNGGDGFACARLLAGAGYRTAVYMPGDPEKYAPDTAHNAAMWDGVIRARADGFLKNADCIVDALFGIGFHGVLAGGYLELVRDANLSHALRVAVDLPSGVETDSGAAAEAFLADETVTFTLPKPACCIMPGAGYCGNVTVADIGIPSDCLAEADVPFFQTDASDVRSWLPHRPADAHKGTFGRALIIGGSRAYPGAPCMSAAAAVRSGAGLVTAAVPEPVWPALAAKLWEAMPAACPADSEGRFSAESLPSLLKLQEKADAVLLGPGMAQGGDIPKVTEALLYGAKSPLVLDADGINTAALCGIPLPKGRPLVLTPHDGEMARLLGAFPPKAGQERVDCARRWADSHGCVLVLKGHRTVIASPDGPAWINSTGNCGMAKGGSGDVLAGMVCAFLAQGMSPLHAAAAAVWLHGAAGDRCAARLGRIAMTPTDMVSALPEVFLPLEH